MDAVFFVACLTAALNEFEIPELFDTGHVSQFTREKWLHGLLKMTSNSIWMVAAGHWSTLLLNGYDGV